jgi:hypothetical protein
MTKILLLLSVSMLVACSHGYRKINTGGMIGGYDEAKLSDGRYTVTYQGQGDNTPATVHRYFLLRAAELAKQDGYPFFKVEGGQPGIMNRGMMYASASMPNYTGTVIMLKDKEKDCFVTDDVIKNTPRE